MARTNSSALITGLRISAVEKCVVELFEQRAAQRRLARAHLAGELDEALALADAVKQMIDRLAMFRAVKQEARVRRDVERRLRQAVVIQIHARLSAKTVLTRTGGI